MVMNKVCLNCNKDFYIRKSYSVNGRGKYCSINCLRKAQQTHKTRTESSCWKCKKVFPVTTQFFYRNGNKKNGFSDECKFCRLKYQSDRAKILQKIRNNFVISKECRCSACGLYNEDTSFFDIDHIVPVFKTKEKRGKKLFYDSKKFQVLCPNCHRLKTIYEKKNKNTTL